MASYADLERTVAIQTQKIDSMNTERRWLEQDNDLQRATVIQLREKIEEYEKYIHTREEAMAFQLKEKTAEYERYIQTMEESMDFQLKEKIAEYERYIQKKEESMDFQLKEKIAEYERYIHTREQAMASELKKVNQQFQERQHRIQTQLKESKEKLQATTTKYLDLKKGYITKSEANKTMKKQMDFGIVLCRGMYNEGQYYKNGYFSLLNYLYCLQQWIQQNTTSTIHAGTTEHLSVVGRLCSNAPVVSAESGLQRASDPWSRVTVNIAYRDCTVSLGLPTLILSSCINIPSFAAVSRRGQLGRLALPPAEVSAVPTANPAEEKNFIQASRKDTIACRGESSSDGIPLGVPALTLSLCSSIPSCETPSKPRKRLRRMALPAPNVAAVSPAHPVGEIDFVTATRTDNITSGDESRSGDTVSDFEVIFSDVASSDEQQLAEAECCSGRKKKGRAGRFRAWIRKFCCWSCREGRKSSGREDTTF